MENAIWNLFDLTDKNAVVTGASGGIGYACAIGLAQAGANVVAHYNTNKKTADKLVAEIRKMGKEAFAVQADVSNYEDVNRMAKDIDEMWGKVDILFNNAGIGLTVDPEKSTKEEWLKVIDTNLNGVFYCAQAFGKLMIRDGGGAIINMGSMSAEIINRPEEVSYSTSKAGVHLMTKGLAACWAKYKIRVNAIAPGYIATEMSLPMMRSEPDWVKTNWTDWTPQRRIAEPEELVGMVVYLASEASSFVTGSCLIIDGGFTVY
ncbi:MAG TPA: SDR family oxidoreductase [Bacillota bacterium]|jgi:NAD(P)-dependent dehydrogenase (short-subunit alcohol dehydrogenase family)|nr:SDR family oxidoreductase [Fastidiosipila sp.]HPX93500.1 SDR family oxidoreductase [Bacillota bacterium]HQB81271.1 SDR family oxidoreductase [Bacillota bacterium]